MISVHRNRPWGPRLKPFTTASALALLLAGCAVGPEYQTPDIELPESWPAHITLEQQARDDWQAQRFPIVPGDADERIPLPEGKPKTVSYP